MGAPLKLREERIDFRRKHKHGLAKLLAGLTKESDGAIEVLVECMKSTDIKVKMAAAIKLLDMRKECEVIINTDDIQRMLLESKNPDRGRGLVPDEDDNTPLVDFTVIQDVN